MQVRLRVLNAILKNIYFSYIVAVSFTGGGNRSTRSKPLACRKSLTNLSHNAVSSTPCHEQGSNSQI